MKAGELEPVHGVEDLYVHDTGMFDTDEYGAVYIYDAERPAVIDTGTGANRESLFDNIASVGIERDDLEWIVPTHAHLDHAGGTGYLASRYPSAEVRTPERGVRHLVDPGVLVAGTKSAVEEQWRYYAEPKPVPSDRIAGLSDGDSIDLGDRELIAYDAPGHAPHHAVFHVPADGVVFTADAVGMYVPQFDSMHPTSPPPQFDLDRCLADMRTVAGLDPEHLCFSHFGPRVYDEDVVDETKRTYVEWVEAIRVQRELLADDAAVVSHFEAASEDAEYWNSERRRANASLNVRGVLSFLDASEGS